jgi:hypothetical protein
VLRITRPEVVGAGADQAGDTVRDTRPCKKRKDGAPTFQNGERKIEVKGWATRPAWLNSELQQFYRDAGLNSPIEQGLTQYEESIGYTVQNGRVLLNTGAVFVPNYCSPGASCPKDSLGTFIPNLVDLGPLQSVTPLINVASQTGTANNKPPKWTLWKGPPFWKPSSGQCEQIRSDSLNLVKASLFLAGTAKLAVGSVWGIPAAGWLGAGAISSGVGALPGIAYTSVFCGGF